MTKFSKWMIQVALCAAVSASVTGLAMGQAAQTGQSITGPTDTTSHTWTTDQLVTSTVHEAWVMSGRNEDQFFDMVQALAAMSAQKRGLTMPEDQAAGVKAGAWIKKEAKRDPDQLLYAVVDKAVVKVGVKSTVASK